MTRPTDSSTNFLPRVQKVITLLVAASMLLILVVSIYLPWAAQEPGHEPAANDLLAQRHGTFLRAFRGIAKYDWQTSLDMIALPEIKHQWNKQCGDLFSTPEESFTFFSHSFLFVSGQDSERWTAAIYNLWIDHWLLLDFIWQKDLLEYRLSGFSWLTGDNKSDLSTVTDFTSMQGHLVSRFTSALPTGLATAAEPQRFTVPVTGSNSQPLAQNVSRRIRAYNEQIISAFASQKNKVQSTLRSAVVELVTQVEEGAISEVLALPNFEKAWRESLFPVHVSQKGSQALVILSSAEDPYKMLMAEFDITKGTVVLRALKALTLRSQPEEQ